MSMSHKSCRTVVLQKVRGRGIHHHIAPLQHRPSTKTFKTYTTWSKVGRWSSVLAFTATTTMTNRAYSAAGPGTQTVTEVITTASGLKYIDHIIGEGECPLHGAKVLVHYTGTLLDGTKFDSSVDRGVPLAFPVGVGRVIKGWDEGIMTMRVGGKRKLVIPPQLGYGSSGTGPIPPNATLIFECELVEIGPVATGFLDKIMSFFS